MCGIFGAFPSPKGLPAGAILESLKRRGPDDRGWFENDEIAMGHTRLSILDLSTAGHQPMSDKSGHYVLVYNGEIYNFLELRHELLKDGCDFASTSDSEVILHGFSRWGNRLFERLRGMFAFAIYDTRNRRLTVVRDRLGIKPLLYALHSGTLYFASELRVFLENNLIPQRISEGSIESVLRFGRVSQPETILDGVQQLRPGYFLEMSKTGGVVERQFATLDVPPTRHTGTGVDYLQAKDSLRSLLVRTIESQLIADVDVGCFLSGGVDSTAILAIAQRILGRSLQSFSVGFDHRAPGQEDETLVAARTAKRFGSHFHRVIITPQMVDDSFDEFIAALDQPSIDGFNTFFVCKAASAQDRVALNGLGGDELFGGYPHYRMIGAEGRHRGVLDRFARVAHELRPNGVTLYASAKGLPVREAVRHFRQIYSAWEVRRMLNREGPTAATKPTGEQQSSWSAAYENFAGRDRISQVSVAECQGYLLSTLLRDTDALSMWHGLELRPVLLDDRVVDFALGLPDQFKVSFDRDNGTFMYKKIFVDCVLDLLPDEVVTRRKTGFELPLVNWMNGALRGRVVDLFGSPLARKFLDRGTLQWLLIKAKARALDRRDWLIVVLIAWLQKVKA